MQIEVNDPLVNSRYVREKLGGISAVTVWRYVTAGDLPKPIVRRKRNYWRKAEIDALVDTAAAT